MDHSLLFATIAVFGLPLLVIGLIAYQVMRPRGSGIPLTEAETLKSLPPFHPNNPRIPRLTKRGGTIAVMASVFSIFAFTISWAFCHKIAATGLSAPAVPAGLAILLFDSVALLFVLFLVHDYQLVKNGRFSTALVVAAKVSSIYSWGIIYDFIDNQGRVVRGNSLRRVFTADRIGFGVGSQIPIVYVPENPSRSSLYPWLAWSV